jgi:hypothetical protein
MLLYMKDYVLKFYQPHIGADVGLCVLSCHSGVVEKGTHQ